MHVPARTIAIPTTTTDLQTFGGGGVLYGWSFVETTGAAAAEVTVIDGTNTAGVAVADIALNMGESTRDWLAAPGIELRLGAFVHVVSGSIRGALWITPGEVFDAYMLEQGYRGTWRGES